MNRLWIKLLGAFGMVILIGVIVTVLVARQAAATQLSHFMVGNQMIRPALLQQEAARFYTDNNGWDGIDAQLPSLVRSASDGGAMRGMMGGMMGMFDSRVRVVNDDGIVVADTGDDPGGILEKQPSGNQLSIVVSGDEVGTLIIDGAIMSMPLAGGASLLAGLTRAVLTGALVAGVVALALAAFVVRQITRPVADLGDAARRIALGDLSTRVSVHSGDELGDLANSFNSMAESLQEQEQLRRNLMADIAHELRTPLSGIQGNIEALQDGVFPLTVDNLTPIHEQTLLLNRMVDDLRTLALADAGELTLRVERVNLEELVVGVLDSFRPQAHAAKIVLCYNNLSEGKPLYLDGDRLRLSQVATNLLANAVRHTPENGSVMVELEAEGKNIRWLVTDTGDGIPPQELPNIFDRFYRTDGSRSRMTGGTGLGLAIVKQIVTAHGGIVSVESPPPDASRGTQFVITLPVS
jgi:two-component system sensor histidine kinase BaeS